MIVIMIMIENVEEAETETETEKEIETGTGTGTEIEIETTGTETETAIVTALERKGSMTAIEREKGGKEIGVTGIVVGGGAIPEAEVEAGIVRTVMVTVRGMKGVLALDGMEMRIMVLERRQRRRRRRKRRRTMEQTILIQKLLQQTNFVLNSG